VDEFSQNKFTLELVATSRSRVSPASRSHPQASSQPLTIVYQSDILTDVTS
jgi:hypothetical protein